MTHKPSCVTPKPLSRKLLSRKIWSNRGFEFVAYKQALYLMFQQHTINRKHKPILSCTYFINFLYNLYHLLLSFKVFLYNNSFIVFLYYLPLQHFNHYISCKILSSLSLLRSPTPSVFRSSLGIHSQGVDSFS